jgi:hypothetical protein
MIRDRGLVMKEYKTLNTINPSLADALHQKIK